MDRDALNIIGMDGDKDEISRYYQAGRMGMLFNLVEAGRLTLEEAADFAGLTCSDAADMLQGWLESRWR